MALLLALLLQEPGLVAEYLAGGKTVYSRVEPNISHALVTGDFHGTKLVERFSARWTGILRCPENGLYNFYAESDDGCRLFLDGELVLDNSAGRAMEQRADRIVLQAGDHAFRFEYTQVDGPAGVNLQWKPPSAGRSVIAPKFLFHARDAEAVAWDRDAWEKRVAPPTLPVPPAKPGRYATIDFGPFLTRALGPGEKPRSLSALMLRVAPDAFVAFDTRDLRVAAAWTGPFLNFPAEKDGVAGIPTVAGALHDYSSPPVEGRWKGLYLHGNQTILSFSVGGQDVLELHGFRDGLFTRTRVNLEPLTKGGPPRWTEPVITKGVLGRESGAYQVDTLTLPYENPWNSYLRLTALDFFPDGRAAVATLDGDVWIVSGIDATLERLSWKRFATGLYQPMGLRVVDGRIHVLGRDQITRLHDLNGDGEADFYENFNNDCGLGTSYGEYAMDLQVGPDGSFYYTKAGTMGYGSATAHNGCVLKVSKDGKTLEILAKGFRAPMGLCVGPDGGITATDQQGNYMGSCPIVRVKPGGFYGFVLERHPETKTRTREPALCWLPMDVDNSSGGQVWATDERWGPSLKGRLIHTSYGQSKLLLVLFDDGHPGQAGVTRFPLQFLSGIMRPQFNPADGQLYVAGLRGWQTTAVKDGCLQRVRYTGKPTGMPVSLRVRKTGIDLGFSDALDAEIAADADSWTALGFNVISTPDYGSPEFQVSDPKKRGREKLEISKASLGADGRTVSLELPSLRPMTNLLVKFSLRTAAGARLQSEVVLTINQVPD